MNVSHSSLTSYILVTSCSKENLKQSVKRMYIEEKEDYNKNMKTKIKNEKQGRKVLQIINC